MRPKAEAVAAVAAAAEQRLQDEDRRIVHAAYNEGKFPKDRIGFWVDACKRDRPKNRAIIKILASGILPPPAEKVAADGELNRVHNKVMAQLGIQTEPRRSVAASSGFGAQPGESLPAAYQMPDMPAPVVIQKGVSPADWTPKQVQDARLRSLGPRFFPGTRKPPAGDVVYYPSPNDVSRFDEASGTWVEKHPYKEIP